MHVGVQLQSRIVFWACRVSANFVDEVPNGETVSRHDNCFPDIHIRDFVNEVGRRFHPREPASVWVPDRSEHPRSGRPSGRTLAAGKAAVSVRERTTSGASLERVEFQGLTVPAGDRITSVTIVYSSIGRQPSSAWCPSIPLSLRPVLAASSADVG